MMSAVRCAVDVCAVTVQYAARHGYKQDGSAWQSWSEWSAANGLVSVHMCRTRRQ